MHYIMLLQLNGYDIMYSCMHTNNLFFQMAACKAQDWCMLSILVQLNDVNVDKFCMLASKAYCTALLTRGASYTVELK